MRNCRKARIFWIPKASTKASQSSAERRGIGYARAEL